MAKDRPRPRPKRALLFLLLLVLLGLLLEMNRWLPGGWPGGGGQSGFRPLDVAAGTDPARLRAPTEASPDARPEAGVRLEVRAADGSAAKSWRAAVGAGGAFDAPAPGGDALLLKNRDLATEGVRVSWPGGDVRHVAPPALPPSSVWRVQVPAASVPVLRQPHDLAIEVTDALTGRPVAGAEIHGPAALKSVTTDAAGRAALPGLRDRAAVRVSAPGYLETIAYGHPGVAEPVRVSLSPRAELNLRLVDPTTGAEALVRRARLVDADGATLWEAAPPQPKTVRLEAQLPADRLDGARLLVESPGRPRTDVPLPESGAVVKLAATGREFPLVLRDTAGKPVAGVAATVRYGSGGVESDGRESAGVEDRVTANADGTLVLHVPEGVEAAVVIESAAHAPAVLRVDPGDGGTSREATVEPGLSIPVRVLDARGREVRDADVVARAVVAGVRVTTRGKTDATGRARVGPLPAGSVEVFAHAPGRAWAGDRVEAAPAMGTVELRLFPGASLKLVVESPLGAPLAGVHVTASPADDKPADVLPPDPPAWRTGADGTLVIEDLPLRPYRLLLGLPGRIAETLHDVRPGPVTYFATLTLEDAPSAPR